MVNSLVIAGLATLLVLAMSLPAAYYTARHRFAGRKAFLYLILVTQMFAPVALVVGIYREVLSVNGQNTYWALVLIDSGSALALATWIKQGTGPWQPVGTTRSSSARSWPPIVSAILVASASASRSTTSSLSTDPSTSVDNTGRAP